ncbi:aminoimidazole riboside kinase [Lelliottia amnigena]|uniref:aminoimidazole riboside kinase n=1 Tax=Lelliottia amnigena TaxID=61646 RepID=UPI003BA131E4
MMKKIWVLGDAVVDLLPDGEGRLLQCPGGAPANVAVGVARLGGESGFIGRVGDDPFGRFMRQTLIAENVNVDSLSYDAQHRTSTVVVELQSDGERSFTFMVRPSADLFLSPQDLPAFHQGQWLHACSIALSAEPSRTTTFQAMDAVKEAGGLVSFDPNIRADLWQDAHVLRECLDLALRKADMVKLSREELTFLTGQLAVDEGLRLLVDHYAVPMVLVTLGKEGVVAWHNGHLTTYSAPVVNSVDTTGAGDAFVAGMLYGLASGISDFPTIIALAQRCGALATTAKGAMTALPYRRDLD